MPSSPHILILENSLHVWTRAGRTLATGHAVVDGRLLEGADLASWLDEDLERRIPGLWGCFAVVQDRGEEGVLAAVDRIRSIPLFYSRLDSGVVISDNARMLAQRVGARLDDPDAAAEFLLSSCVIGSRTLTSSVAQLQAGELVFGKDEIRRRRYYSFTPETHTTPPRSEADLLDEGIEITASTFRTLAASLGGRPIAIPLSGGIDSRLIAGLLVSEGVTNIRAFTYGSARSFEARASRRVAKHLGLPWRCVPYSPRKWNRWFQGDDFQELRRRATGLTATEHEQDWPAVKELLAEGWMNPRTVVIPGHTGDFISGGPLPEDLTTLSADPYRAIYDRYYTEWRGHGTSPERRQRLLDRIRDATDGLRGEQAYTTFGWQERQAKLIANSVRVYDFFDLDWRLPFWADPALLDFWRRVPVGLLQNRRLFLQVCRKLLGEELFNLPSTLRRESALAGKWRRLVDPGFGRYGAWLGPYPLAAALRTRVRDFARVDHPVVGPVVDELAEPILARPPQWISLNGMLALGQLRDLATEGPGETPAT